MGFRNGAYAKVWEIEPATEKTTKARISISRKDRTTNEYVNDFSGYVTFIGAASNLARTTLMVGDRIKLEEIDVSSWYNKEKNKGGCSFKIFNFSKADSSNSTDTNSDGDYPFESTDLAGGGLDSDDEDEDAPF